MFIIGDHHQCVPKASSHLTAPNFRPNYCRVSRKYMNMNKATIAQTQCQWRLVTVSFLSIR